MKVQSAPADWQATPTVWGQAPQVTICVFMHGVISVWQPKSVQAQVAACV
jgi:hypothetical protein